MNILVLDQCSGSKATPSAAPEFEAAAIDEHGREALLARDGVPATSARELYIGRQQQFIDSAVERLRESGDTVVRKFVSAGFGLVDETTELPPYDVTFDNMSAAEIDIRADRLGIPTAVREAIHAGPPYDVVFLAVGSDYYRACRAAKALDALPDVTIGVVFSQDGIAEGRDNIVSIPAGPQVAGEHGTIAVAIKGRYIQHFACHRFQGRAPEGPKELAEMVTTDPS